MTRGPKTRIGQAIDAKGITIKQAAASIGLADHREYERFRKYVAGERKLTKDVAKKIARHLGRTATWLMGLDDEQARLFVPLVGYVGAGEQYYPDPEAGPWMPFGEVDCTLPRSRIMAVRVRGSSMEPVYRDGEYLCFERPDAWDPGHCIGRDCIISLRNGLGYIKRLERHAGEYVLASYNGEPIRNAEIEWAAPVEWVKRNRGGC